jgi:hypothetical protein
MGWGEVVTAGRRRQKILLFDECDADILSEESGYLVQLGPTL